MSATDVPDLVDLRTTLAAVPVARDVVRVGGPEAIGYLQGQVSQEVESLEVGASAWTFVLQPTGKVDAWARLSRLPGDELVLDVDGGSGERLVARLRRFLLRTKAEIEPLAWTCVALRGPDAAAAARGIAGDAAVTVQAPAGWPGVEGVDLLGPDVRLPDGMATAGAEDYESLRIRSGVPAMGAELTERTIPAEVGQWVVDASVDFAKGCFTGQELVARIDSRGGNVPHRLRGLVVPAGERPPVDVPVVVEGAEVGRVTSVARAPAGGHVALASVRRAVTPPVAVELALPGGGVLPATLVDVPVD